MNSVNYNLIAPYYDFITKLVFNGKIQKAQLDHLEKLPQKGNVLFIGGGSGYALKSIAELKPELKIDYIESSSKMIKLSRNSLNKEQLKRVQFIKGDTSFIPSKSYDCVITFFFLDLFEANQMTELFSVLSSHLKVGGLWFLADFNLPIGYRQKAIERLMYWFLKIITKMETKSIPDIRPLFNPNRYSQVVSKSYYSKFIFSIVLKHELE